MKDFDLDHLHSALNHHVTTQAAVKQSALAQSDAASLTQQANLAIAVAIACHLEHLYRSAAERLVADDDPEQAKRRVVDFYRSCQARLDVLARSGPDPRTGAANQVETVALNEFLSFAKQFHGVT